MEDYIFWYKLERYGQIKYIESHYITPEEAMEILAQEFNISKPKRKRRRNKNETYTKSK